jgi:hypothetical protein
MIDERECRPGGLLAEAAGSAPPARHWSWIPQDPAIPHIAALRDELAVMGEHAPQPAALAPVWLANATRTSGGIGPGVVQVPADEAVRLVAGRRAVHSTEPLRGAHLIVR